MDFDRLAKRYRGARAQDYEGERAGGSMWPREQKAVDEFLACLPAAGTILDIPVGTGRFFELYKKHGLRPTGLDISPDMLAQASNKARDIGASIALRIGDVRKIEAADRAFDCALCLRFFNWIDMPAFAVAFAELSRVARSHLIAGVRCSTGAQPTRQPPANWARRLKRRIRPSALAVHDKSEVERLFASNGWSIQMVRSVDRRDDGTDHLFYLLRRNSHP